MAKLTCETCGRKIGGLFGSPDYVFEDDDYDYHFCSASCCEQWRSQRRREKNAELDAMGVDGLAELRIQYEIKKAEYAKYLSLYAASGSDELLKLAKQRKRETEQLGKILGAKYEGEVDWQNPEDEWSQVED